jgi:hypothetical protein
MHFKLPVLIPIVEANLCNIGRLTKFERRKLNAQVDSQNNHRKQNETRSYFKR